MNMKTNITILAASLLFCACSSDNEGQQEDLVPITLTATMIVGCPLATRTTSTDLQSSQFANGQTFYAYFTSSSVVPQSTVFTADGSGGATPASQPYFKLSGTTTDVRAYYPSTVTESTTSFVVEADQTSNAGYRNSDLMYASATISKVYPVSTGELAFAHKMAKIRVQTVNNGSSVKSIKLKGIKPTVDFTASTGVISAAKGSATDITMFSNTGQTSDIDCVALIPPQAMTSGTTLIEVTTALHSSSPLTYQLPANISFASGMQYIFTVNVHEESLTVSCNVTAWGTGNTASTAVNFYHDKRKNPLWYVTENNVKSYNNSTKVVTFETNPAAAGSSYCYKWSDAMSYFAKQTTSYDTYWNGSTITDASNSGFRYHLPTQKEWFSVMPQAIDANVFDNSGYQAGGGLVSSAQTCIFGYNSSTQAGIDDWSYWSSYTTANVRYAIRFLGTDYCSVWKYEFNSSSKIFTITAKLIDRLEKNDASLSTILATYIGNSSFWTTLNEDEGDLKRVFYAVGYRLVDGAGGTGTADTERGTYGCYWSATQTSSDKTRSLRFYNKFLVMGNNYKIMGFSVRLFRDY